MADEQAPQGPSAGDTGSHDTAPRRRIDLVRIATIAVVVLIVLVSIGLFRGLRNRPQLVPDVGMMTSDEARATIEAAGFDVGTESLVATGSVAPDRVIEQAPPAGQSVSSKTPIDLKITTEPKTVSMPDLIGMTGSGAVAAMEERQIKPVSVQILSEDVPTGEVFEQYPIPGADAIQGEVGAIAVSAGRPTAESIVVPNVEQMNGAKALSVLEDAGLKPTDYYTNLYPEVGAGGVIRQVPPPGSKVKPGAEVVLFISASPN